MWRLLQLTWQALPISISRSCGSPLKTKQMPSSAQRRVAYPTQLSNIVQPVTCWPYHFSSAIKLPTIRPTFA